MQRIINEDKQKKLNKKDNKIEPDNKIELDINYQK